MSTTPQPQVELIPLETLLGNPDRANPQLSPDGKYLAYVAPHEGVLNIWLRTVGKEDGRALTKDSGRGIWNYGWTYNGEQILYSQDKDGDENDRLYSVNIHTGETRLYTPDDPAVKHPVKAMLYRHIPERPDEAIIALNKRDQRIHDLYLLNLRSGQLELVQQSDAPVQTWLIDHSLTVRGFQQMTPEGGAVVYLRNGGDGPFEKLIEWEPGDTFSSGPAGFLEGNDRMYLINSAGRNTSALVELDLATGKQTELASDPGYDIAGVLRHPTKHHAQAVSFNKDRRTWQALDGEVSDDLALIKANCHGDFGVVNRTLDDKHWLVGYSQDTGPVKYYAYDRAAGEFTFLFNHRDALAGLPLQPVRPIQYTTRDGLTVHGYLTTPAGREGPGPLVLNVHGGPWHRDSWGFNPTAQWLANRGYACLQVNFRGSVGYGKEFLNAGDREWGGKMQDDLTDAVKWAISEGIADKDEVVIHGGSYGGYATLAGVTFTPDVYKAGIAVVGPSNLETFLNTIPPYWESMRVAMDQRVARLARFTDGERAGQPKAPADMDEAERAELAFLKERSPLFKVDKVKVPMLIAQGANDPRVNKAESDQFVDAMRAKGLEVEYVVYEDEGHGFARPQNRLDFYHRADKFLAKVLGGRSEKWEPEEE